MADKKISELTELTTAADDDLLAIVDDSATETKKITVSNLLGTSVFGEDYQTAESDGTDSTASSTFQQKLRLTTTSLPAGDYYVTWAYEIRNTTNDDSHESQVELDDTTQIFLESGAHKNGGGLVDAWRPASGHKILSLFGVHTIDIDYRAPETTVEIRRAKITLWRVA